VLKGFFIGLLGAAAACTGSSPAFDPSSTPPLKPAPPVLVVTHVEAGSISILDLDSGQIRGRVGLGQKIGPATLSGDGAKVFVSIAGAIAVVDLSRRQVERTLPLPGEHSGLVSAGSRLFVTQNIDNKGKVSAIDVATGRVESERAIDDLTHRPEVSLDGRRLYVPHSFYSGRITILDTKQLSIVTTLTFEDGPTRARLSPDDLRLLVPNGSTFNGRVSLVNTLTRQKDAELELDDEPTDAAVTRDGRQAVVPLFRAGQVAVLDLASGAVARKIAVEAPIRLALGPDDKTAYVLRNATNLLSIISLDSAATRVLELDAEGDDVLVPDRVGRP
jgi:DNA-binding beta-propeller fold protein YncE